MSLLEILMVLLLLGLPWGEGGAAPLPLFLVHSAVFAAAALAILRSRGRGALELRLTSAHLAYGCFLLVGFLSFLRATYVYGSFETLWDQAVWLLLALALAAVRPSESFARAAAGAVAAAGAAQALVVVSSRLLAGGALSPSFVNLNHTAAYLNVAAILALGRGGWLPGGGQPATRPGGEAAAWRAAGILCVAGCLASGSRGGMLSLGAVLAAGLWWGRGRRSRNLRLAVPLALAFAAIAGLSIYARFSAVEDPYRYMRPRLWGAAIETWTDAPALGIGPGMYEHRALRHNFPIETAAFRYSKQPSSAHSAPIQVLAEEGVAGLLALVLFAGAAAACLRAAARRGGGPSARARAVLMAAAVAGVHAFVEMPFEAPAIPITLLLLAWPVLDPPRVSDAFAFTRLSWPRPGNPRVESVAAAMTPAAALVLAYAFAVAAPYLSFAAAAYAETPGRAPVRIETAARLSEHLNPYQPFLGFRRARAALLRVSRLSPPLLANASESLTRATWLEPGDPGAYLLLGRLYARSFREMPGAGPGALDRAEREYTAAIDAAPLDARLFIERAAFRLSRGDVRGSLRDGSAALDLEPNAIPALQVRLEALLTAGRTEPARRALAALEAGLERLGDHSPLNAYEESLARVDAAGLARARDLLSP